MKSYTFAMLATMAALAPLAGCAQTTDFDAASDGVSGEDVAAADQALTPAGGDQCETVDAAAIGDVLHLIESAQARAALVVVAHPGVSHTYLAEYLVTNLESAHTTVSGVHTWIQGPASDNDPNVTNYVEGLEAYAVLWNARPAIDETRWYALLSTVYLHDTDAYVAYERISLATEIANDVATKNNHYFMATYNIPGTN